MRLCATDADGGVRCSNMEVDMTFDVAMETGRARRCLAAPRPDRSFTPLESVLMTLAGREAEASDPSRLIPGREEKRHTLRLSCFTKCWVRRTHGQ